MTLRPRFRLSAAIAFGLAGLSLAAPPARAQDDGGYSYIRTLDGSATLILAGSETRESAEINQPILPGDQLLVSRGSRVELYLSDRSLVHVDGGTEIAFEALAFSPEGEDDRSRREVRASLLRLLDGEIRVETDNFPRGFEPPQVETGNATVYLGAHGTFRVVADQDDWSEVTVREGSAEVATERGSRIVRENETAVIEGVTRARIEIGPSAGRDGLERWAAVLLDQGDNYRDTYVDEDLRYSSEPLSRYGSWITIERRQVWRPRVASGWRPYSLGRWRNGPGGSIWISSEPWGWVPYHYGTWDYFPGYGWGWVPGRVFSPAWVYWYWGPSYVGWCPIGYYTRYYGGSGFRDGLYGWAHGSGSFFAEWNFVPFSRFRDRDLGRHVRRGRDLRINLERGIVTTDTRPLGRERWSDPTRAIEILRRGRPDLPDVSDFVARKRDLPPAVRREIAVDRDRPGERLNGTPLRPETLGRGADGAAPGARTADVPRGRTRWNTDGGAVEGQPAPDNRPGRDSGRSGLDTRTDGRETGRGTETPDNGRDSGRSSGRSGLDTRDSGRERTSPPANPSGRTGGDTPAGGESVERRRPESPSARPASPDSGGGSSNRPEPEERRRPIYERPDNSGGSGDSGGSGSRSNEREAEPAPVRERPVVRERPDDSPPPSSRREEPPAYRRNEPAPSRDEPSATRREEPSSPPPQEARPRERQSPDSSGERSASPPPRRENGRDRPRSSNDSGEAGAPPPR